VLSSGTLATLSKTKQQQRSPFHLGRGCHPLIAYHPSPKFLALLWPFVIAVQVAVPQQQAHSFALLSLLLCLPHEFTSPIIRVEFTVVFTSFR
jgi:hypothetical protein